MNRRFIEIILATIILTLFSYGPLWADTTGTGDGTYDFGSLGAVDTAGSGYTKLGDKFKVANAQFTQSNSYNTGPLTAIYPTSATTPSYTAIIKAEGVSTCDTFTFKDLGISAYTASQSLTAFDIVLKDKNGIQIGSTISLGSSGTISTTSVTNISTLYSHAAWSVDNVAAIEITYTSSSGHAYDLNFENITIANVSAPSGPPVVISATPSYGPIAAGTSVVISGGGFTGATAVKFDSNNATSFNVDSATQITAVAPAGTLDSIVHITVTTPLGTSATSTADQFTYTTNTLGTADGTYNFGSLGIADSAGSGYAKLGDKFKVGNSQFIQSQSHNTGPPIAVYPNTSTTSPYTAIIKAEGGATCKTFTFKDLGISAYAASQTFNSFSIVLKDINGVQIGSTISLGSSGTISTSSVTNISTLYSHAVWAVDNVAAIEITYTVYVSGAPATSQDLSFETINIANVSVPSGAPDVFGASPSYGPTAGGTSVIITGGGFTGATAVKFGSTNAISFNVDSATQITAVAPAGTLDSIVHITVTTPLGTSATSTADQYTYTTNTLGTADGIYNFGSLGTADSAGSGYAKLGDKFKVGNTLFLQSQSHNTGPPIAIYPNINTTTSYTAIIKAEGGATCKTFTFKDLGVSAYAASQTFTALDIVLKDINGSQIGSTITLGSSGTISTTSVTNISSLYSHAVWSVDNVAAIEVTFTLSASGSAVASNYLSFENITIANVSAAPTVTGVSPTSGPTAGGTSVTITGTNLTGATAVTIGGAAATSVTVVNSTTITATTPAGTAGARDVVVTTPGGTGTGSGLFTYIAAPTVTGISPTSGPATGGTSVTITGTNLTGATAVTIGGAAATGVTVVNATTITTTIPAGTAGARDVVVTTPGGTGTGTGLFTYATPPSIAKAFGAATIPLNGSTSLSFTIANPAANAVSLTGLAFTDNLPAGLVVATPNGLSGSCGGGTITATASAGSISLSGATLATNSNCTFSVNVTGTTAGVKNNSVQITSTEAGAGNTTNASVTVVRPPVILKAFGAASIPLNGSTSLSFTVQNNNTMTALTGIGFSDTLPAGLVISTPNGLSGSCGGTITATQANNVISLSGATLALSSSCTFSVNVTGSAAGTQNNTTGNVNSTEGGTGGTASASINVVAPPSMAMAFGASSIQLNGTTSLTFTITNPVANAVAETGAAFTDALPAGLVVATPNGLSSTCGGTATAVAGSGSISLTGGTIAASSNCTVTVNITGVTSGSFINASGAITSTNGGTGNTATANLSVVMVVPTANAASAITATGFTANWNSITGATGYYLDVATDSSFASFVTGYNNKDVGNVTSKPLTGLTSATPYYYRVRAYDNGGSGADSNIIPLTTGQSRAVTTITDSGAGSLRQVITDANSGDTITFSATGTITLGSPLVVSKDLIISGPGSANLTISGGGTAQVFQVTGATNFNLEKLTIANGTGANGGALSDNSSAITTVTGCVFTGNAATGSGGAIHAAGTMTINDTLFSGNSAVQGGAILNNNATLSLTNVTITGNSATINGGGIYTTAGTATIVNTTIAGNSAAVQGGGIEVNSGTLSLKNTIVAGNAAGAGNDIAGSITSLGYNLIKDISGVSFTATTGDLAAGSDPKLGTLADNGGTTRTMALLSGSPAIDTGACTGAPTADQRGMTRPQNVSCDMGAYERGVPAALTATAGTPQSTAINTVFATPLSAKVVDSLGVLLDGVSVAFAGPGSGADIVGGNATTNTSGIASFSATANGTAGSYAVTATVNSLTANYSLTNKATQTIGAITFTPSSLTVGGTTTAGATATSNLGLTFSSLTTGICTVNGTTITGVAAGICTIAANQAGNASYAAATQVTQSISVAKGSQTITFGTVPAVTVGGTGTVSATAGSGLPVTFSSLTTSICTVSGSTVTGVSAGTCTIAADQAGNANYTAAVRATQNITIAIPLALTVSTLPDGAVTTTSTLNVSGTVTNPSTLTINGTSITVNSDGSFSYPLQLVAGTNAISVIATNTAGNTVTDSRTVTLDSTAPSLTVTSPPDNKIVSQSYVTVNGSIADGTTTVTWSVNGSTPQTASLTDTTYSFTANLNAGMNTIQITATNTSGAKAQLKRTVRYQPAFSLAVTDPATDIRTVKGSYLLTGTVADNSTPVTITISMDGQTYTPTLTNGVFRQLLAFSSDKVYQIGVTGIDQNSNSVTVQRNIIHTDAGSSFTIVDALQALQMTVGTLAPSSSQTQCLDVAPMVNGVSVGDGIVDIEDTIVILRMAVGLIQ